MSAVDVKAISKRFGDFTAVDGISFSIEDGEIFGLLGPNGAGKSTLIRMLTTLVRPTSGTALVAGHDVVKDPNGVRRAIGVIAQNMTSDLELSVWENLLIFAKLYGVPRKGREKLLEDLIAAVDLTKWTDSQVQVLSGGMRRRVEIARGLVHQPQILFLDEPTTGLDALSRAAVWELIRGIRRTRKLTVLLTTHYLEEADHLCDRIAIVDRGGLVALDTPLRLKAGVPGKSVIEVSFAMAPPGWSETLKSMRGAERVIVQGNAFRVATSDGPATTRAILEASEQARVAVQSLSVASTSLDDVFAQYTGRQLRESSQQHGG